MINALASIASASELEIPSGIHPQFEAQGAYTRRGFYEDPKIVAAIAKRNAEIQAALKCERRYSKAERVSEFIYEIVAAHPYTVKARARFICTPF